MAQKRKNKVKAEKETLNLSSDRKGSSFLGKVRKPKIIIPLIGIAVLILLFLFRGLFIVATVNGEPISRISLIRDLEKRDGKQVLSQLISQTLILQEANKKNITVSQEELNESAKKIEGTLSKQGQNLDATLGSQGLTRQDFLAQLKIQKIVEKRFASEIKVSDKEINEYIEKNKSSIPEDMKPEDVKTNVRQQLGQQKLATKFQPWLQELQKNAKINYFVNY